jgi:hypothetical protein
MNPSATTSLGAVIVALACCVSIGAFGGGSPTIAAPASFLLVIPVFSGVPVPIAILLVVGGFALWSLQLFRGVALMPLRTIVLLLVTVAASIYWYAAGWSYGLKWEGREYTTICATLSGIMAVACAGLVWRARVVPNHKVSVAAHTLLFAWMATYGFAYLGETP